MTILPGIGVSQLNHLEVILDRFDIYSLTSSPC